MDELIDRREKAVTAGKLGLITKKTTTTLSMKNSQDSECENEQPRIQIRNLVIQLVVEVVII